MSNFDGRRLSRKELTELRRRAVGAVQKGESPEAVAQCLCVSRAAIYKWLALYRSGGWQELEAGKRGGRKPKVNGKAMKWIYDVVTMKCPEQFKFPFALWTSKMIAKLIKTHLGISLSKASVCRLLKQLGLSAQKPLWRARQQDPGKVERWLNEEYPRIAARARREGAEIWFADEAGVRSDQHSGRTWGVKGGTPTVSTTGARFGLNIISAVNRLGAMRFMCVEGRVNASVFIDFLERLAAGSQRKVFLIVDGHPTHKAKKVAKFLESLEGKLELFFLPPYSPELNPDEMVWNDLKSNCIGRKAISGPDMLKKAVISYMLSLQRLPKRIASYFRTPETRYAV